MTFKYLNIENTRNIKLFVLNSVIIIVVGSNYPTFLGDSFPMILH